MNDTGSVSQVEAFERFEDENGHYAEVRCDPGGGDLITPEYFAPSGDDSPPLPGDMVAHVPGAGSEDLALAYQDYRNAGVAKPAEKRLYARDEDGNLVCTLYMKSDGQLHLGEDTGAAKIARADLVEAELAKIKATLDSLTGQATFGEPYEKVGSVGCDKVNGT